MRCLYDCICTPVLSTHVAFIFHFLIVSSNYWKGKSIALHIYKFPFTNLGFSILWDASMICVWSKGDETKIFQRFVTSPTAVFENCLEPNERCKELVKLGLKSLLMFIVKLKLVNVKSSAKSSWFVYPSLIRLYDCLWHPCILHSVAHGVFGYDMITCFIIQL